MQVSWTLLSYLEIKSHKKTVLTSASNAGGELYLSTDQKEKDKTKISEVYGGFPTEPYEYDKYVKGVIVYIYFISSLRQVPNKTYQN